MLKNIPKDIHKELFFRALPMGGGFVENGLRNPPFG
jgi:hypothetical protein